MEMSIEELTELFEHKGRIRAAQIFINQRKGDVTLEDICCITGLKLPEKKTKEQE